MTEVTIVTLVLSSHVSLQLRKCRKNFLSFTDRTPMGEQCRVLSLDLIIFKADLRFPVHLVGIVLHLREDGHVLGEHNLVEVSATEGALLLLADDPHLGGADVTYRMVTLAYTEHLNAAHTQLAGGGGG